MSSIRTRRAIAGATAAALGLTAAVVTLAGPAGAVSTFEFTRLAGVDRYATAAAVARSSFANADVALLANGQSDDPRTSRNESHFPDALAGSYLAGARTAPTLLTTETSLPAATESALSDLGVTTVVILGGPAAVSTAQEEQLEDDGFTVERVGGTNRYETAAAIARAPGSSNVGTVGGARTAVVASGVEFPDALVMGPLSYASSLPLTITDPQRLSPETRSVLTDLDIDQVLIPGGTSAVSARVQAEIESLGITVRRFEGATRTQTATLVAEYALSTLGFSDTHINLARGDEFPDALTGGPHAGRDRAPILLTARTSQGDALGAPARDFLTDHCSTLEDGHIFGGTSAVSSSVENDAEAAARSCGGGGGASPDPSPSGSASPNPSDSPSPTPSPTGTAGPATPLSCTGTTSDSTTVGITPTSETPTAVTTRPELTGAEFADEPQFNDAGTTDSRDDFCSVDVRFTFDEPVIGKAPVPSLFKLVGFEPTTRFSGQRAVVEAGGTDVVVTFGRGDALNTTTNEREDVGARQLEQISLAAVDQDAVADNTASGNPIGDTPLGVSRIVPRFPSGITAAPDLIDVNLGNTTTTTTSVQFVFDETVASVVKATGFHIVTASNRDGACASPLASGTTVTVSCATTASDPIVRAYVESDTVSDEPAPDGADGNLNPLHAEDVTAVEATVAPDLVRAEFRPVADGEDDLVLFTFDEAVFIGDPTRFVVYQQDTDEFRSASATRQADPTQVLARFEGNDEDLNPLDAEVPASEGAVGVSVLDGAVIEAGDGNRPNQEDEVGVLNAVTDAVLAGRTQGPDLLNVLIDADMGTATFVFDETLSQQDAPVFGELLLYESTGRRLICRTGAPVDNTVVCNTFQTGTTSALVQPDDAVVGTADDGAVVDESDTPNPEGAAGVS